jgi:hypothetical protein
MFLEHNGLTKGWEQGARSEWEGELGDLEKVDDFDCSGMGPGNDVINVRNDNDNDIADALEEEVAVAGDLSLQY